MEDLCCNYWLKSKFVCARELLYVLPGDTLFLNCFISSVADVSLEIARSFDSVCKTVWHVLNSFSRAAGGTIRVVTPRGLVAETTLLLLCVLVSVLGDRCPYRPPVYSLRVRELALEVRNSFSGVLSFESVLRPAVKFYITTRGVVSSILV